jgi:hypothetical protein
MIAAALLSRTTHGAAGAKGWGQVGPGRVEIGDPDIKIELVIEFFGYGFVVHDGHALFPFSGCRNTFLIYLRE